VLQSSHDVKTFLGVFRTKQERRLKELKDAGKIEYIGSKKTGGYEIVF